MPPEQSWHLLAQTIEEFLAEASNAVVREDGLIAFDLDSAKFSISTENNKCLLHLWSDERNIVRRVDSAQQKNGTLRLQVRKFGQAKPTALEICRERDQRTPSAARDARTKYKRLLGTVLRRDFPGHKIERLSSAVDLEHSFGPAYVRCIVRSGRQAFAVIGVNEQETQSTIDNILAAGLLWLDLCRSDTTRALTQSLHIFVPPGRAEMVRVRLANLNQLASQFHLHELDERDGIVHDKDIHDAGNIATRLVRCHDRDALRERFRDSVRRVLAIFPGKSDVEMDVTSTGELAFRWHGLEFARVRNRMGPGSFQQQQTITFGAGAHETPLTEETEPFLRELVGRMMHSRRPGGQRSDPLWRMQPERWLESLIMRDIQTIDARLDPAAVYRQVPAFAASDRAMIDLLTCTHDGRLAVIEIKASEDLHLALQGLDYWARVNWHHQRGEFQRFRYFPGRELSPEPPLLFLVAPALQVHPASDAQLKYFSDKIVWTLIGVNEDWRSGVRVIFRKARK